MTAGTIVQLRPTNPAELLEELARKPLAPHRHELRMLAERQRALDALNGREPAPQLTLEEVA